MSRQKRRGFTLIEVLVVVAIIALLVAILLPSLSAARDQASATVCKTRLRELAMGHIYYSAEYKEFFPHYEWWLWDAHPTSWGSPENLGWYTNNHIYDKSGGTWWQDSSRWVEYGQIYKYMRNKETYFCPKDKLRRAGVAIGGGTYGKSPLTSFSRVLETHDIAMGVANGGVWGDAQAADAAPTDFLSQGRINNRNLGAVAPQALKDKYYGKVYETRRFNTTPDRVALLFEEWPNAEGVDTLGKCDPEANVNQWVSMDNATSFPTVVDLFSMRHMGRSDAVFWDGHVNSTRKGASPNYHRNGYAGEFLFGAGTVNY